MIINQLIRTMVHRAVYTLDEIDLNSNIICTVFIQIDAHARIDAHPPSSSSSWHTKMAEIDDFSSKIHRTMMNSPYSCNYSVL